MAMSKLDFITILIVAICVGALGFLVYKTVKLMNPDEATTEVTEQTDPATAYDPADDYSIEDADSDAGEESSDDSANTDGESADDSTTSSDEEEDYPVEDDAAGTNAENDNSDDSEPLATDEDEDEPSSYDGGSSSGAYMVLAGSYKQKVNANNQVNKLQKLGYDEAKVHLFNGGALAVALVDRFDSYSDAIALKKELEDKGFDVFIKKKK